MFDRLFKKQNNTRVSLAFDSAGVSVAMENVATGESSLHRMEVQHDELESSLQALIEEQGWEDALTVICLPPKDYLLVQTEKPDVAEEEINNAVLWNLGDLVPWDLAEITIDTFEFPQGGYSQVNSVNVVVCRDEVLRFYVDLCHAVGLQLEKINTVELSLLNLLPAEQSETPSSLLTILVYPENFYICLFHQQTIYLSRKMEIGENILSGHEPDLAEQGHYEQVTLDIQRSLDYFESTFSLGSVRHALLFPEKENNRYLKEFLLQNLEITLVKVEQLQARWSEVLQQQPSLTGSMLVALANLDELHQ